MGNFFYFRRKVKKIINPRHFLNKFYKSTVRPFLSVFSLQKHMLLEIESMTLMCRGIRVLDKIICNVPEIRQKIAGLKYGNQYQAIYCRIFVGLLIFNQQHGTREIPGQAGHHKSKKFRCRRIWIFGPKFEFLFTASFFVSLKLLIPFLVKKNKLFNPDLSCRLQKKPIIMQG